VTHISAGRVEDYRDGQVQIISVGRREIGVVRWHDRFFAVRNVCPHEGAGLCQGTVRARLQSSEVGRLEADDSRPVVTCPWHGWEFDLQTGSAVFGDPSCRVRSYPTHVSNDMVIVDV